MIEAFVFGKFLPLHNGHVAMIHFALRHCDKLTVLVCAGNRESIPGALRGSWVEETFRDSPQVSVQVFDYDEAALTNSSISSEAVSAEWAEVFTRLLPKCSLLFTSEPYGEMVAAAMNIDHLSFDPDRTVQAISATAIRTNPAANRKYLPLAVRRYYALKVVILGTESTGKSTLAEKLAAHFFATLVTEAGRDIVSDSNDFCFEDLYRIVATQTSAIESAAEGDNPLLIIDTDLHITDSYARHFYGLQLNSDARTKAVHHADLYLYLCNDVPHVQDGTRLPEAERNALDASHRQTLAESEIRFKEIAGDWESRFKQAVHCVERMLSISQLRATSQK